MAEIQTFSCPCCGASLTFSGKTQSLHCEACGNDYSVETLKLLQQAEQAAEGVSHYDWAHYEPRSFAEAETADLSAYTCPSCGGEITGDDALGATVCPYCGSANVVKNQFEGALRPDYLIPFQIEKKEAMAAFEASCKKAPFLPDVFLDKKRIAEMTGVYLPFWMFDCTADADITYRAQRVSYFSDANYNYTRTDHFKLWRSGNISFANLPVDGSKKADNAYTEAMEPFDYSAAVPFNAAYLSGYMAERYDVSAEACIPRANERIQMSTEAAFAQTTSGYGSVVPEKSHISFSNGKVRYSLLPAWMLSVRYADTLYRFFINGQTAKVVGEYPTDKKKKRRYFAKVAVISYAVAAALAIWLLRG